MNRIPFFTQAIAAVLQKSMAAHGLSIPVLGDINPPAPEHLAATVSCTAQEEIIPGNDTYRLECTFTLSIPPADMDVPEITATFQAAQSAALAALRDQWHHRPLPDPRTPPEPEYAAAPFIVLALIPTAEPLNTDDGAYTATTPFRAYVQF